MKTKLIITTLLCLTSAIVWSANVDPYAVVESGKGGMVSTEYVIADDSPHKNSFKLTPQPEAGYEFLCWNDKNTDNPRYIPFAAVQEVAYTAYFYRKDATPQDGDVAIELVDHSLRRVKLTANSSACARFEGWTNSLVTSNEIFLTEADCEVLPIYDVDEYNKSFKETNGNAISLSESGTCQYRLTAQPADSYVFYQWQDLAASQNVDEQAAAINPVRDVDYADGTYKADFIPATAIAFEYGEHATGTIANAVGVQRTAPEVTADEHYQFQHWADANDAEVSFPYFCAGTLHVVCTPIEYTIDYTIEEGKGDLPTTAQKTGTIESPITLPSVENVPDGWQFLGWKAEGTETLLAGGLEYTLEANVTFVAQFKQLTIAEINGTPYMTIADAIAAANADQIIDIMMNGTEDILIAANKTIHINGNSKAIGAITIEKGGELVLASSLTATNLYLASESGASSQMVGVEHITLTGDAFVDITMDKDAEQSNPRNWYAFAVPFTVNTNGGVSVNGETQVLEQNFRIATWDGATRATTGTGWQYPYTGATIEPGRCYLFTIDGTANVWRFKAADKTKLAQENTVSISAFASGNDKDAGWNAVANPTMYYTTAVATDINYAYIYDNANNSYIAYPLDACSFVMGSPFIVQSGENQMLTFSQGHASQILTPARATNNKESSRYIVSLTDDKTTDYLYLTLHEDAEERYVIGRDLSKMRSSVPQLWTTAYGVDLAAQDAAYTEDAIIYDLNLYATKNGIFTLSVQTDAENKLYLMQDGVIIWNLTMADYTLDLPKGISTEYNLMIRPTQATVTTDNEVMNVNAIPVKYIHKGMLYIHANGKTFNAQGGLLK